MASGKREPGQNKGIRGGGVGVLNWLLALLRVNIIIRCGGITKVVYGIGGTLVGKNHEMGLDSSCAFFFIASCWPRGSCGLSELLFVEIDL